MPGPRIGTGSLLGRALGHDGEDLEELRNNLLVRLAVVGLAAVVATWWQAPGLLRASRSAAWPSVYGTVSDVTRYRAGVKVNLRYVVGGRTYMMEGQSGEPGWQEGTAVTIYYDPTDPENARRAAGWSGSDTAAVWVIGGLWGMTLALVGVLAYRVRRASQGVLETDD